MYAACQILKNEKSDFLNSNRCQCSQLYGNSFSENYLDLNTFFPIANIVYGKPLYSYNFCFSFVPRIAEYGNKDREIFKINEHFRILPLLNLINCEKKC